ncbi:MAG: hypothetical protein M1815_001858 [Lichina confinis]|nr:MAG: hypothetical protein M1815_001858 [Lichina confinis]
MERQLALPDTNFTTQLPTQGIIHDCSFSGDAMLSKPALKHSHISDAIAEESCHPFNNPEKYTSKNQEVLQAFIRSCEHLFTLRPITYCEDQQRIMYAVNNMKGDPKKAFLNDQHQPEHLRTLSAYHKWCQAQQGVTQSVNSFVAYLDEIEGMIDVAPDVFQSHFLIDSLRPELKLKVLEKVPNMTNRAGIVQATITVEVSLQMSTQQDRGSGASGHVRHSSSSQSNWQFQGQSVDPSKSKEKDSFNPNISDRGVSRGSSFHTGAG